MAATSFPVGFVWGAATTTGFGEDLDLMASIGLQSYRFAPAEVEGRVIRS